MGTVTPDMLKDEVQAQPQRVVVVDLDMELGTMIWFLVKLAIAAIPAACIVGVVAFMALTLAKSLI